MVAGAVTAFAAAVGAALRATTGLSMVDAGNARIAVGAAAVDAAAGEEFVLRRGAVAAAEATTGPLRPCDDDAEITDTGLAAAGCGLIADREDRAVPVARDAPAGAEEADDRAGEAEEPSPLSARAVATPGPTRDDNPNTNAAAPTRAPARPVIPNPVL